MWKRYFGECYETESIFLRGKKKDRKHFPGRKKNISKITGTKMNDFCEEQQLANFCETVSYTLKVYTRNSSLGTKYE